MIDKMRFFRYLSTLSPTKTIETVTGNVPLSYTDALADKLHNYRITCKSGGVGDLTADGKYLISFYNFSKNDWGTVNLGSLNYQIFSASKPGIFQVLNFCTTYSAKQLNNIYCGKLKKATYEDIYYERVDDAVCILPSNGRLYIRCSSCSTVAEAKSYVTGNSLVFEKSSVVDTPIAPSEGSIVLDKLLYANEYIDYATQTLHKTSGDTTISLPQLNSFSGDNFFFVGTKTRANATIEYYK